VQQQQCHMELLLPITHIGTHSTFSNVTVILSILNHKTPHDLAVNPSSPILPISTQIAMHPHLPPPPRRPATRVFSRLFCSPLHFEEFPPRAECHLNWHQSAPVARPPDSEGKTRARTEMHCARICKNDAESVQNRSSEPMRQTRAMITQMIPQKTN
jgi:hypothetical protein